LTKNQWPEMRFPCGRP